MISKASFQSCLDNIGATLSEFNRKGSLPKVKAMAAIYSGLCVNRPNVHAVVCVLIGALSGGA